MNDIPNLKYKTTLCLSWLQGVRCIKNYDCYFAHGEQELRTIEQNRVAIAHRNQNASLQSHPHNYKTVFCKFYGKGECRLGDACTFAHERRQRPKQTPPPYHNQQSYEQYYAYYQLTAWMGQYLSSFNQISTQSYYDQSEEYSEKICEEDALTADSHSPALSKSSTESEITEKENCLSIMQNVAGESNEDER